MHGPGWTKPSTAAIRSCWRTTGSWPPTTSRSSQATKARPTSGLIAPPGARAAAQFTHVLPYSELFGPNALGTAELIRIALTSKQKPYTYVSTIAVGDQIEPAKFTEDADIRIISPPRKITDTYATVYGNSKW